MRFLFTLLLFFIASFCFAEIDSGYIYVIKNETFKRSIYKIGMTRQKDPYKRIKQLYTTSVASPFEVKILVASDSVLADEKRIHKALKKYRIDKRREFFKCDYRRIKSTVEKNITKE